MNTSTNAVDLGKNIGPAPPTQPVVNFATSRFGNISITEEKIIHFVQGLPGFEKLNRYILIDHDAEGYLKWLQAVDDADVAFLLTNPVIYKKDYTVPLKPSDVERLYLKKQEDLVILTMLCVTREDKKFSINLKGPILFNSANMKAMQCIIDKDEFPSSYIINV